MTNTILPNQWYTLEEAFGQGQLEQLIAIHEERVKRYDPRSGTEATTAQAVPATLPTELTARQAKNLAYALWGVGENRDYACGTEVRGVGELMFLLVDENEKLYTVIEDGEPKFYAVGNVTCGAPIVGSPHARFFFALDTLKRGQYSVIVRAEDTSMMDAGYGFPLQERVFTPTTIIENVEGGEVTYVLEDYAMGVEGTQIPLALALSPEIGQLEFMVTAPAKGTRPYAMGAIPTQPFGSEPGSEPLPAAAAPHRSQYVEAVSPRRATGPIPLGRAEPGR